MKNYLPNIKSFVITVKSLINSLYKLVGLEGIVWISALIYLATYSNYNQNHFTICPLSNLGIDNCPGCGLGRSVSMVLHGQFLHSFDFHWLGIPALIIILFRIFKLIRNNFNHYFKPINKGANHA